MIQKSVGSQNLGFRISTETFMLTTLLIDHFYGGGYRQGFSGEKK